MEKIRKLEESRGSGASRRCRATCADGCHVCLKPRVGAAHPTPTRRQNLVHEVKHTSVWDNYEIVREIGHGMTGKVHQVQHRLTKEVYALKCESLRSPDA